VDGDLVGLGGLQHLAENVGAFHAGDFEAVFSAILEALAAGLEGVVVLSR
jgi:hypothetical protein